jgi:hypothetical protein
MKEVLIMGKLDNIRIVPFGSKYGTAVSTSESLPYKGGDFSVLCEVNFSGTTVPAATGADLSATDAGNGIDFTVYEGTVSSAAGTAITGATLTLGCGTVCYTRGAVVGMIEVTSNLTTAVSININGIDYHTNTTGPGRDGENVATELAAVINGRGTNQALPHYTAYANELTTGVVTLKPNDNDGTGVTIYTTAAASTFRPFAGFAQGVININAGKLSTATPKFLTVVYGEATADCKRAAYLVTDGKTPGAIVNVTT